MNLNELIEELQELAEQEGNGERTVLAVHQPNYPLQENVRGVYDPLTAGDRELLYVGKGEEACTVCSDPITGEAWRVFPDQDSGAVFTCVPCEDAELEQNPPAPLYLVVNGHPHDLSPYGPREAFN